MSKKMIAENLKTARVSLIDGTKIPLVGLGTYQLKGRQCVEIVDLALTLGYRHIDTALIYENHQAIAEGIKGFPRNELYLTSKLWIGDQTAERVPLVCEQILNELQTEYLDLLLIHWPDQAVPVDETLMAMHDLAKQGKVRSIGVSNFTIRHVKEALITKIPIVTNQVEFHPFLYQKELQKFCRQHEIVVTAHTPFARGLVMANPHLAAIGLRHRKSATQIVLRWLLQRGCVVIPKTQTPARLAQNGDLFDFSLSDDELHEIDALHTNQRTVTPRVAAFDDLP